MKLPPFLKNLLPQAADAGMDDRYFQQVGAMAAAGVTVTPDTAVKVSAVYRCVALIANAFASLPFGTYRRLERGREELSDHPATRVMMDQPNPYQLPFVFKRLMMGHLALRGNAYARIWRGAGEVQLWPLHPARITGPELLPSGRLRYRYRRPDNNQEEVYLGGVDLLHLTGLSTDGLRGLALADIAKDSIGLAMATEQYGSRLFSQGVRLAGVLKTAAKLDPKASQSLARQFRENWGGQNGAFGVPVLEQGLDFQAVGMSSEDAQFLETRKFEISDIARWFGVPPHMVGDVERSTSWGTGIEAQSIQFVEYGLVPWCVLWEQAIRSVLIPEPDAYGRFNVSALLRADTKTRHEVYEIGIRTGMYSPNDCRELEEKNPRPDGDVYADPRKLSGPSAKPPAGAPPEPEADPAAAPEDAKAAALTLAVSMAEDLLEDEASELAAAAAELAGDAKAWRGWLASFYGRRAARVSKAMRCSAEAAKEFCVKRRDRIMREGLAAAAAEEWVPSLAALAAGGETC